MGKAHYMIVSTIFYCVQIFLYNGYGGVDCMKEGTDKLRCF